MLTVHQSQLTFPLREYFSFPKIRIGISTLYKWASANKYIGRHLPFFKRLKNQVLKSTEEVNLKMKGILTSIECFTPEVAKNILPEMHSLLNEYSVFINKLEDLHYFHSLPIKHKAEENIQLLHKVQRVLRKKAFSEKPGKKYEFLDQLSAMSNRTVTQNG